MAEFLKTLWQEIRPNAKWDIVKLAGAAMLATAYALIQKIRHLPFDWYVFGFLFVLSSSLFFYFGRKGKQQATVQSTSMLPSQQPTVPFDWKAFLRTSYTSQLTEEAERNIRLVAAETQPNDKEGFYARLIGIGVVSYFHDVAWAYIFKSQLLMLLDLNHKNGIMPLTDAKKFYDDAVGKRPETYTNYSFAQWMEFMTAHVLVIRHPSDMLEITIRGKDFLKYLTHNGYTPDQRGN